ncbi:MAG: LysM peptidoglycan-binding domain-containing protein [Bacillota bacterium]
MMRYTFPKEGRLAVHHHKIKPGDTLFKICKGFSIKMDDVLKVNAHIRRRPHRLKVGEIIVLPVRDAQDCLVIAPRIEQFLPAGATVVETQEIRLSGRRVSERVIIFRTDPRTSGVVVIDFTCVGGWRVVWRREGVNLPLRVSATGRITSDDRVQVVIGSDNGTGQPNWFFVLGWEDERPTVLLDWEQAPANAGFRVESGAVEVTGPAGLIRRYNWDGRQIVRA